MEHVTCAANDLPRWPTAGMGYNRSLIFLANKTKQNDSLYKFPHCRIFRLKRVTLPTVLGNETGNMVDEKILIMFEAEFLDGWNEM